MASMVDENWDQYMDGQEDSLQNLEFSQINHNFLMSLLDETQVDDCDDERLTKVIQSLEAEIVCDDHYTFDHHNAMWEGDLVDCQSSNDESNGHDRLLAHDGDLDHLQWMDMEAMPSSPSWDIDHHHGQAHLCYGTPLEEPDYGSLWHETNFNFSD